MCPFTTPDVRPLVNTDFHLLQLAGERLFVRSSLVLLVYSCSNSVEHTAGDKLQFVFQSVARAPTAAALKAWRCVLVICALCRLSPTGYTARALSSVHIVRYG